MHKSVFSIVFCQNIHTNHSKMDLLRMNLLRKNMVTWKTCGKYILQFRYVGFFCLERTTSCIKIGGTGLFQCLGSTNLSDVGKDKFSSYISPSKPRLLQLLLLPLLPGEEENRAELENQKRWFSLWIIEMWWYYFLKVYRKKMQRQIDVHTAQKIKYQIILQFSPTSSVQCWFCFHKSKLHAVFLTASFQR